MLKKSSVLFLSLILSVCVLLTALTVKSQIQNFSRPTVIAARLDKTPFYHIKVFEDDDYLFAYRHYGKSEFVPGFFVQNKKSGKWLEIKKISTEHAKLGSYNLSDAFITEKTTDERGVDVYKFISRKPDYPILAISWNFHGLKQTDYVELPLRTSGSIVFPEKIIYDQTAESYKIILGADYNIEEMQTLFWIRKEDLKKASK